MQRVTLLLALVAGAVVATPAAAHASAACPARGAHVLVSDRLAAVYWFPKWYRDNRLWEGENVYACARGHAPLPLEEVVSFGDNAGPCTQGCLTGDWRRTITLAGSMLAYATDSGEQNKYPPACNCERWGIVVRDLTTGRFVHRTPTGPHHGHSEGDFHTGVGPALAVVAEPDGSVAWVAENFVAWIDENLRFADGEPYFQSHPEVPLRYELYVSDRSGERVLSSGTGLDPRSLGLVGHALQWTMDGEQMSAALN